MSLSRIARSLLTLLGFLAHTVLLPAGGPEVSPLTVSPLVKRRPASSMLRV